MGGPRRSSSGPPTGHAAVKRASDLGPQLSTVAPASCRLSRRASRPPRLNLEAKRVRAKSATRCGRRDAVRTAGGTPALRSGSEVQSLRSNARLSPPKDMSFSSIANSHSRAYIRCGAAPSTGLPARVSRHCCQEAYADRSLRIGLSGHDRFSLSGGLWNSSNLLPS
jgi:hypothetical protein